jgi:hypothetical protein
MAEVRNSKTGAMLTLETSEGVCKEKLEKYATSIRALFSWNQNNKMWAARKFVVFFVLMPMSNKTPQQDMCSLVGK